MIVRDEAAVIERCLSSVADLIDAWVICDTGSRDGTPELIERALSDVPGRLHHDPWRDFGWNRTRLMEAAQGAADYLLLLDADMTLEQRGAAPALTADAYLLRHAGEFVYWVPRLVRGDRRWRFEHTTHEYLTADGEWSQEQLDFLVVHHHGDGSSRQEKFERDRLLLEGELAERPSDPRATFYLAQTLADLGEERAAIELYERRVELGGWDEEAFYAAYRAGALLARLNDGRAVPALLRAWELRPSRAEPLYELARFCRFRGWRAQGRLFAERGAAIELPADVLFVHHGVYSWGMAYELGMACYWLGELDQARAQAERLLAGVLPAHIRPAVEELRDRCAASAGAPATRQPAVRLLKETLGSMQVAELQLDIEPAWPQFNPTVAVDGDGFRMIVRSANYVRQDGRYLILTDESQIRTLNYLVRLDGDLAVRAVAPLQETPHGPERFASQVTGYEDCRLVQVGRRWFATATVRDRNPGMRAQIALLALEEERIVRATLLQPPFPSEHEKNWMPFVSSGRLRFVYSCAPTVVLECDLATGRCVEISRHQSAAGRGLRGSSPGVAVDGGYLFVTHHPDYRHRFVLLDDSGRLRAMSPRFNLVSDRLEYCAGLARAGDRLLVSFGVDDARAMLAVMDLTQTLEMLEPISD